MPDRRWIDAVGTIGNRPGIPAGIRGEGIESDPMRRSRRVARYSALVAVILLVPQSALSAPGRHLSSAVFGGTANERGYSITGDPFGNAILVGGSDSSTIDLGGGPHASRGGFDIVVAKYASSGSHLWSKRLGGSDGEEAYGVATDAAGNILVAGYSTSSSIDVGGGSLDGFGGMDMVIAKFSAAGAHVWSKRLGGSGNEALTSIASDPSGNVFVAGHSFGSTIDLGGGPFSSAADGDMIAAKFSSDGSHVWSKLLGGTDGDKANAVASDPSGNFLLAGFSYSPAIDFGGGSLPANGNFDIVLAKYSAAGTHTWSKRMGGSSDETAFSIASDPSGNVLVAGHAWSSPLDLGGGSLSGLGGIIVAKYAAGGGHLWSKRLGGNSSEWANSVASDASGNVLIAGWSNSLTVQMGGASLPRIGGKDIVVAKYSGGGTHLWSRRVGGTGDDEATSIAADAAGNVLLAGGTNGPSVTMGGDTLPTIGWEDMLVARYTDDDTPPDTTLDQTRFTSPTVGIVITGTATDERSGVERVTITYTHDVTDETEVVEATLTCNSTRRSCDFSAVGPSRPGRWLVQARARDRAANVDPAAATIITIALV